MSCTYTNERNLLTFSTLSCFCFAVFGVGLGLWAGSMIIVFDGVYSLVSVALSLMALIATVYIQIRLTKVQNSSSFHHKQKTATIESIVVLVKGLVISGVCIISFISAIQAMFDGGRHVETSLGILFALINVIGCLATYLFLKKQISLRSSPILKAESNQWLMDTVISAAVLGGFLLTALLIQTDFAYLAIYADPLMVILASVYFISVPLKMVKESTLNLTHIATNKNTWQPNSNDESLILNKID